VKEVGQPLLSATHRATFIERLGHVLHLPYPVGCAVWALLLGAPTQLLALYVDSFSLDAALARTFYSSVTPGQPFPTFQGVANQVFFACLLFYLFYTLRYVRLKVAATQTELLSVAPQGEQTLQKVFRRVSHSLPAIVLSVPFALQNYLFYSPRADGSETSFFLYSVLVSVPQGLLLGTWVWVYFASLMGVNAFGKEPLRLKSFAEDSVLGLRPLGILSLSLAVVYLGGLGLAGLTTLTFPDPAGMAALGVLLLLGPLLFFVSLRSVHRRMLAERQRIQAEVRGQLWQALLRANNPHSNDAQTTLARLVELNTLQTLKQEVANIPVWPFDTRLLGACRRSCFQLSRLSWRGLSSSRYASERLSGLSVTRGTL
jgi:hypothetical protein